MKDLSLSHFKILFADNLRAKYVNKMFISSLFILFHPELSYNASLAYLRIYPFFLFVPLSILCCNQLANSGHNVVYGEVVFAVPMPPGIYPQGDSDGE